MFFEIAREGPPSAYELKRLQQFEMSGRRNNILLQTFDLGSDIAFMFVLFDQAGAITLPEAFAFYKGTAGNNCISSLPLPDDAQQKVLELAIASAVVIGVSSLYRLFRAGLQIYAGRKDLGNGFDWIYVLTGAMVAVVDPWNGALFINDAIVTEGNRIERSDYTLAVNELKSDISLVLLEDIPQLVIQIIYGVLAGQTENITAAWFVAIFSTCMHLASQLHEIFYLAIQLPALRRLEPGQLEMNRVAADE